MFLVKKDISDVAVVNDLYARKIDKILKIKMHGFSFHT